MKPHKALSLLVLALLSAACSLLPAANEKQQASYDFGPGPAPASDAGAVSGVSRPTLIVADVAAPAWLESNYIFYRLAYADVQQPRPYASSRWIMPPAELVAQRAKLRLATFANVLSSGDSAQGTTLQLELQEFSQVFDAPEASQGMVRMRASLIAKNQLLAQRSFAVARVAPSVNAAGGVRALTEATDQMLEELAIWVDARMRERPQTK